MTDDDRKKRDEARNRKKNRNNRRKLDRIEAKKRTEEGKVINETTNQGKIVDEETIQKNKAGVEAAKEKIGGTEEPAGLEDEVNKQNQEVFDDAINPKDPNTLEEQLKKKNVRGQYVKRERDSDGFLKIAGQGLQVFGETMDKVDQAVLGRIGFGDKNLYTARRGIIDGLSERHVALALLGEFLLPDTVDLATFGLGYIPKRFLKTPKLLKAWAKSTKVATRAEAAEDAIGASLLGGRPRLAQRTVTNELGDEVFDNVVNANKATQRPAVKPLTTPERQKVAILAGKGDALDLDAAVRGPGLEGKPGTPKYSPTVRKETTKIDRALVNELQSKYGGTDYHVKAFLKQQQDFLRQVEEARSALNKEFKLLDFGFGFDDMIEALEGFNDYMKGLGSSRAMAALGKVKPDITPDEMMNFFEKLRVDSGAVDIGHKIAAKNHYRLGQKGANYASNLELEPARNLVEISLDRRRNEVVKLVEKGNRARGSRKDLPTLMHQMMGTSKNIDEEYLKFLHPELDDFLTEILPVELHDDFQQYVMEALEAHRRYGIQDFNDYIEEVWGFDFGGFKMLPKQSQKSVREGFRNQKGMVHGQQQLDMYNKPFKDEGLMKENYNHAKLRRNPLYPRGYRNGYHESWIEEIINDYLNDSMQARELGLLDTFLNDKTARGFGAGVVNITGDTGAGIRKIGEEIIDENPIKQAYRKTFTENPVVEARARQGKGRPKGKKNKPKS